MNKRQIARLTNLELLKKLVWTGQYLGGYDESDVKTPKNLEQDLKRLEAETMKRLEAK